MTEVSGYVGDSVLLELQLDDRLPGLFPQVTLYTSTGAVEATLDLLDRGAGLYQVNWPAVLGQFSAVFLTYTDAAHTTLANYDPAISRVRILDAEAEAQRVWLVETADVVTAGTQGEALAAMAGHAGRHTVLDGGAGVPDIVHDVTNNQLQSARLRVFASKAAADAATLGAADGADGELLRLVFDVANYVAAPTSTPANVVLQNARRSLT